MAFETCRCLILMEVRSFLLVGRMYLKTSPCLVARRCCPTHVPFQHSGELPARRKQQRFAMAKGRHGACAPCPGDASRITEK